MCHWPCLAWIQAWDGSLGVQVRLFSWLFSCFVGRTAPFSAGTSVNRTRLCLSATSPLLLEAFNREPPVWTINKGGVLTKHLKTFKFFVQYSSSVPCWHRPGLHLFYERQKQVSSEVSKVLINSFPPHRPGADRVLGVYSGGHHG